MFSNVQGRAARKMCSHQACWEKLYTLIRVYLKRKFKCMHFSECVFLLNFLKTMCVSVKKVRQCQLPAYFPWTVLHIITNQYSKQISYENHFCRSLKFRNSKQMRLALPDIKTQQGSSCLLLLRCKKMKEVIIHEMNKKKPRIATKIIPFLLLLSGQTGRGDLFSSSLKEQALTTQVWGPGKIVLLKCEQKAFGKSC